MYFKERTLMMAVGTGHHHSAYAHICLFLSPKTHYSPKDCTFNEKWEYITYNKYESPNHHLYVVLFRNKYRQDLLNKKPSLFLPIFARFLEPRDQLESKVLPLSLASDSMDPFRITEDLEIKSPSFQK